MVFNAGLTWIPSLTIDVIICMSSIDKEDEMQCLIKGCNFLLKNIPYESFVYQRHCAPDYKFQASDPDTIFPYLLVNVGSGVSFIKVTVSFYLLCICNMWPSKGQEISNNCHWNYACHILQDMSFKIVMDFCIYLSFIGVIAFTFTLSYKYHKFM